MKTKTKPQPVIKNTVVRLQKAQIVSVVSIMTSDQQKALRAIGIFVS